MSILDDYEKVQVEKFRGPNLLLEPTDVIPPWCLSSLNVDYLPGSFATRTGFYAHRNGLVTSGLVSGAFNWQRGNESKIVWCVDVPSGSLTFRSAAYNDAAAATLGLGTIPGPGGAAFAQYGKFVYVAKYDVNLTGAPSMDILDMSVATPTILGAFNRPLFFTEFTLVGTVAASGDVTPGVHKFAVVFQDTSGFLTRPSPVQAVAGLYPSYSSVNVTTTGQKITVVATPATVWPSRLSKAYLVMTTATNNARLLYVPIEGANVPAGTATAITFSDVTIPDVVLAEQDDIGDLESVLTQDAVNNPPFNPYFVFSCGSRMGYLAYQGNAFENNTYNVLVSNPGDPQHLTSDRHIFQLPQQRQASSALYLQGTLYVFGPNWTYAYTDTGDVPVNWPPPRTIDDKLGTAHPYGVSIDSTGFGFVAHRTGLYVFSGGEYASRPMSYYETPLWNTIDWSSIVFNVVIDAERFRVLVFARFVDGTRKILVWDYTEGYTADKVKFSIHTTESLGTPQWGLIVMNRGDAQSSNYRQHLWMALASNSVWQLARNAQDPNPYLDGSGNIAMTYQMAYLPGTRPALVHEHHGLEIRALGQGTLRTTAYPLDLQTSQALAATPLSAAPAKEATRFFDLRSEGISHKFQNSTAAGDYVRVSIIRHYHKPYVQQR